MKHVLLLHFILLFLSLNSIGQTFVPEDVLVSAPDARICDIEIDPYGKRICWQTYPENELWVCHLDTTTWALAVPNGKEVFVDDGLTPLDVSVNGAEWGYDRNGTYLFYSTVISHKKYITIAYDSLTIWSTQTLTDCPQRMNPHATQNPTDSFAAFSYLSLLWPSFTKYKYLNDPYNEHWVQGFRQASWVRGERKLIGINNDNQVALFTPGLPNPPVQLTDNIDIEFSKPYMWNAPDQDSVNMFFAIADGEEVRVYKYPENSTVLNKSFQLYTSFRSPSANPEYVKIGSAEPFIYEGHSYITFMTSSSEVEYANVAAEIWIAKLDSLNTEFRRISDSSIAIRTDPEAFATPDSLIVYYNEIDTTVIPNYYRIRKCRTGYGKEMITSVTETKAGKMIFYPNPFTRGLMMQNSNGNEHYCLTDLTGRIIWTGKNIEDEDLSGLSPGPYLISCSTGGSYKTSLVIKK